jgi:uroporphyrinogen-III decarboxylase
MSYEDGMAALTLQTPPRVPRTEYSVLRHWNLVAAVTGMTVGPDSPPEQQYKASLAMAHAWNFDFNWTILIHKQVLAECCTSMGHAEYASGGTDRNDQIHCPFSSPEEVLAFDPWETYGRRDHAKLVADFENHYRQQCENWPGMVNMTGIYVTLVSGLIEIFGWDMLLLAAGTDPQAFGEVTNRYASWIQQYFDALAEADVPVVMIHDDIVWTSGPFISPDWYRQYVFPNHKKLFAPLVESGKIIAFTSDGTYTMFIDDLAGCGVHGFVMEPTTDMAYVADHYGKSHFFIGNADTRILLQGPKPAIRSEVQRCMNIGKPHPGYFMAVGNHIPANTPVDHALYYNEVYEELAVR